MGFIIKIVVAFVILILGVTYFIGYPMFQEYIEKKQSETAQFLLSSMVENLQEEPYVILSDGGTTIVVTRDKIKEQELKIGENIDG
jgi:Tfp pilus assembly protein PilE